MRLQSNRHQCQVLQIVLVHCLLCNFHHKELLCLLQLVCHTCQSDSFTNESVDFFSLVRSGSFSCSDSPDWLISQDDVLNSSAERLKTEPSSSAFTTSFCLLASRSARFSPIQKITFNLFFNASSTFAFSISKLSLNSPKRRSEWPRITY